MIIYLLNEKQKPISVIDSYFSYIWSEEYGECGTFELYLPMYYINDEVLNDSVYIYSEGMENSILMIIEDVQITRTDNEDQLILTGRSLESILDRRIVWEPVQSVEYAWSLIFQIVYANLFTPTDERRKIPGFTVQQPPTDVVSITAPYFEDDIRGMTLYEAVSQICKACNLGFRVSPDFEGGFIFSLYRGVNRTVAQTKNPPVVFSTKAETLFNTEYFKSIRNVRNVVYVLGQEEEVIDEETGEVTGTRQPALSAGDTTGLARREGFVQSDYIDEETDEQEYLTEKALEYLEENKNPLITFDGELNERTEYKYKVDYNIGDLVEVLNDYGIRCVCRITEVLYSYSDEGRTIIPTFTNVSDEEVTQSARGKNLGLPKNII